MVPVYGLLQATMSSKLKSTSSERTDVFHKRQWKRNGWWQCWARQKVIPRSISADMPIWMSPAPPVCFVLAWPYSIAGSLTFSCSRIYENRPLKVVSGKRILSNERNDQKLVDTQVAVVRYCMKPGSSALLTTYPRVKYTGGNAAPLLLP